MGPFLRGVFSPSRPVLGRCVRGAALALSAAFGSILVPWGLGRLTGSPVLSATSHALPPIVALLLSLRPGWLAYRTLAHPTASSEPRLDSTEPTRSVALGFAITLSVVIGVTGVSGVHREVENWVEALRSVPAPRGALAVDAGPPSCAILDNHRVKCWGTYDFHIPWANYQNAPAQGVYVPAADGMGAHLPVVPLGLGRTVLAVSSTNGHSCAVLDRRARTMAGADGGAPARGRPR